MGVRPPSRHQPKPLGINTKLALVHRTGCGRLGRNRLTVSNFWMLGRTGARPRVILFIAANVEYPSCWDQGVEDRMNYSL